LLGLAVPPSFGAVIDLGRGITSPKVTAEIVEIDLRERPSRALALFPDGGIGRGFGLCAGEAIQDAQPRAVLAGVERVAKRQYPI
jgi:hypothetical protein